MPVWVKCTSCGFRWDKTKKAYRYKCPECGGKGKLESKDRYCPKCGWAWATHNDDGSCVTDRSPAKEVG